MRRWSTFAVVAVAGFIGVLSPGAGAAASTLDPVLMYSGTSVYTQEGSAPTNYPVTVTVDCSSRPCTAHVIMDANGAYDMSGGAQPLTDGAANTTLGDSGSQCDGNWISGGPVSVLINATTATATRDGVGSSVECPSGTFTYFAFHIDVTAAYVSGDVCLLDDSCASASPTPTATAIAAPPEPADDATPASAGTPGILSTLPSVASAAAAPNALWAVVMATVLILLIALPSHLLNSAVDAGTGRLGAWWRRVRPKRSTSAAARSDAATKAPARFAGWPLAAAGVLAASFISSFVDPAFGLNAASPRVFASILVSFLLDAVAGWFIVIWLVRRSNPSATATFRFVPATLLVVAAAVLFTRLTGFQPGIVFGLVAGVVFGTALAGAAKVRVTLIGLGYGFVLAIAGWIGYSLLSPAAGDHPVAIFASETLSALAIGGIAALPIALVPLRGLAGHDLFTFSRWLWVGAYGIGLFAFFFVLMPVPFSWATVGMDIWTWVGIYLAYAVVAVVLWLALARPWRREAKSVPASGASVE